METLMSSVIQEKTCSMGSCRDLGKGIYELSVKNGTEFTREHMEEFRSFFEEQSLEKRFLLLDRSVNFTFAADGVISILKMRHFERVAVYGDKNPNRYTSIQSLFGRFYSIRTFPDRDSALEYLSASAE